MVKIPDARTVFVGAIAGAVVGVLVSAFIVVFRGFYEGWDDSYPVLELVLNGIVLVPGAAAMGVAGVVLANRVSWSRTWWAFGLIVGLVIAVPIGIPVIGSALWDPPMAIAFAIFEVLSCGGIGLLAGRIAVRARATV